MNENQPLTHGIANKGFSGLRGFASRINFCSSGYKRSPQSLTCYTANRYSQPKERQRN